MALVISLQPGLPEPSVHSRTQTLLNEPTLIVSYLPTKTANVRRAKFKRLRETTLKTVPSADTMSGLTRWCEYDPQNFNIDSFTFMFKFIRPSVFENLEFVISGSLNPSKDKQYVYQVNGVHNSQVVYSDVFETELAWDFLQIREDFSGDNDLMLELDKTVYPFQVTLGHNSWSFTDCMGKGHARSMRENIREFWFDHKSQTLAAQIVQCVWSLTQRRVKSPDESKPVIAQFFKGYFDNLVELADFADHVLTKQIEEKSKLDSTRVLGFLQEFLSAYDSLVGKALEAKKQTLGLEQFAVVGEFEDVGMESLKQLLILESQVKALVKVLQAPQTETNPISRAAMALLPKVETLKITYKHLMRGLDIVYVGQEDLTTVTKHLSKEIDALHVQFKHVLAKKTELSKKGLPWRSSLSFFSLLQKSLLLRILCSKLPKFKCVNVKNKKIVSMTECYYETKLFNTRVVVCESEVLFIRPNEPVLQVRYPARMNPSQFRLEGLSLLLNIKNRGIHNWGMAIYRVDLSKLKQERVPLANLNLTVQKLYSYDVMISFSVHYDTLVMIYIKGLICLVGAMNLRAPEPEKAIEMYKGKTFFGQLVSEGDKDPNLKDVVWAHLTMVTRVFKKNAIFMITNYEKDVDYGPNMASQRLYSYSINDAMEMRPITCRFLPFSRLLFDGRRIQPRHLSIFSVRRIQFVMISSDRLNFHLTAFANETFQTVNSWTKPKSVLTPWLANEAKSVMSAWDERKARMYLYTKEEEDSVPQGLKYMIAQLKL